MSRPTVEILREIAHIHQEIMEFKKQREEAENRLQHIKDQQSEKQEKLQTLKDELRDLQGQHTRAENKLSQVETNLERAEKAHEDAHNESEANASAKQIETLKPQKEELTEKILNFIEEIETKEKEIKETEEFIEGSKKTEIEVNGEVQKTLEDVKNEIQAREDDIEKNYIPALPQEMHSDIKTARKKYYDKRPFATLKGKACGKCGQSVDSMQMTALERGITVELCTGCGRILLVPS